MWAQYRKTAIPMQIGIFLISGLLLYLGKPWQMVLPVFVVMQIGAVLGAWWGLRLKKKIEDMDNRLPLDKR